MRKRKNSGIVTAVDLGSYKTSVLVGKYEGEEISILGYGASLSRGMAKGSISDLKLQAECIEEAVEEAERISGVEITSAFVGISEPHINCEIKQGAMGITTRNEEIRKQDVRRVISLTQVEHSSLGRKILHCFPLEFKVDDAGDIKNPVGLFGKELKVETIVISSLTTILQNMTKCMDLVGLKVEDVMLSSLASGEMLLSQQEKDLGVAIIDVGGEVTDILIYKKGVPIYISILTEGGDAFSEAIANQFHIPLEEADRIKKEYGSGYSNSANYRMIKVASGEIDESEEKQIDCLKLAKVLQENSKIIVSQISEKLEEHLPSLGAGIVLTGGVAELAGLKNIMDREMEVPVRVGRIKNIPDSLQNILTKATEQEETAQNNCRFLTRPSYATCLGLFCCGVQSCKGQNGYPWDKKNLYEKTLGRIAEWMKDFF